MSWLKKAFKKVKNGFKKSHLSRNIRRYGLGATSMLVDDVVKHSGLRHTKAGKTWRHPARALKNLVRSDNTANNANTSVGIGYTSSGRSETIGSTGFHRYTI